MKLKILILSFLAVFLCASIASATTIPFGDSEKYWPGWYNGKDNNDTVGIPDFSGGEAVITDNGYLTSLMFNYSSDQSWAVNKWWVLSPGDLFINILYTEQDKTWDYLVKLFDDPTPGPSNTDPGAGPYGLYSISHPLNDPLINGNYISSGKDGQGLWAGYNIRDEHPVALNVTGSASGLVYFDGWDTLSSKNQNLSSTFDLTNQGSSSGINIGSDDIIVAWGVNCANDVVYEKIPNPVPEPATMLLFGSGLIGLAAFGRKKFRKTYKNS